MFNALAILHVCLSRAHSLAHSLALSLSLYLSALFAYIFYVECTLEQSQTEPESRHMVCVDRTSLFFATYAVNPTPSELFFCDSAAPVESYKRRKRSVESYETHPSYWLLSNATNTGNTWPTKFNWSTNRLCSQVKPFPNRICLPLITRLIGEWRSWPMSEHTNELDRTQINNS